MQNHADQFVNLNTCPSRRGSRRSSTPGSGSRPATRTAARPSDSGTDIGPEAICYRTDLLDAGRPRRPTPARSPQKWSTWDDFITFGKQYEASSTKPSGSHFVDSAASIFSTAVYQGDEAYDNADGQPDVENSDGVKNAWSYATQAAQDGITAGLQQFTAGLEQGVLQRRVRGAGLPDVDDGLHPGPGRRRLRRQVEHRAGAARRRDQLGRLVARCARPTAANKDAAIALVEWLSAKDQQVTMWTSRTGRPLPVELRRGRRHRR